MVATYQEFAARHRTQHLNPVNRSCAVVANYLAPVAVITAVLGRPKAGAALFAFANLALVTGILLKAICHRPYATCAIRSGPCAPMSQSRTQRSET